MSFKQPANLTDGTYANRVPSTHYSQPAPQVVRTQHDVQSLNSGYAQGHVQASQGESGLASMIGAFSQSHIGVPATTLPTTAAAMSVGASQFPVNASYFYTQDGQLVYAPAPNLYSAQPIAPPQLPDGSYGTYPSTLQYLTQAPYPGYIPGYSVLQYTPGRSSYYSDRSDIMHKDVPGLENRRGSYSTNESAPGTPYYGSLNQRDHGTHIAAIDRSPIYSTPSPQQLPHPHVIQQVGKPLPYKAPSISIDLDSLLQQHPTIPRAVPAVYTPRENLRTLEQSLANQIPGNRNVYIRGLHPNTDDETLAAYASRFGRVETSKAIIDTSTGACKGFGFAKYYDVRDSELCIRGFYKLGYEVGFARESFNSRLKANGDENSTNLYVSNLPKNMNEAELGAIFMDYTVSSSRILRDSQGHSRGVGFARFESRDICEEIIKKFHGQPIGEEGLLLQVRYADTPAQKDLKRVTSERRQFRTNEYNAGAYGTTAEMIGASSHVSSPVLPRISQIAHHLPLSKTTGPWKCDVSGPTVNGSAIGVAFQDLDKRSVKCSATHGCSIDIKDHLPAVSTPTVSDNGSDDEGATIQGISPAIVRGSSSISPSIKK